MQVRRSYTDHELVNDLKNSKEMDYAIRHIYQEYYALLENYVLHNKGTKEDAADIIQEAIVAFIEIIEQNKFRGDASVKSFLYSIVRNLWLTEMRKRNSAEKRNSLFEKGKDLVEQETTQHLIRREHYATIIKLFETLGEKCRQLLMLVYYEDYSMADIINQMPEYSTEQALRNKKYKCMKQLDEMIQQNEFLRTQFKNALKNAG